MSKDINMIIIAGAGTMGSSIAQVFAGKNYNVTIYDISEECLAKSKQLISINQSKLVENHYLTKVQSDKLTSIITFTTDISCFKDAEFVSESIVENMNIKKKFWSEVSEIVNEDAILTTNTSGLSITEISKEVTIPERFVGMHWINPPHIIPLVEVICGNNTSDDTKQNVYNLAINLGKKPILVNKDVPGFALNRLQFALLREAIYLTENNIVSFSDADKVMTYALGIRYCCTGPFVVADMGGLDTFYNISKYLFEDLADNKKESKLLKQLCESGRTGVKVGAGIYDYDDIDSAIKQRDNKYSNLCEFLSSNGYY